MKKVNIFIIMFCITFATAVFANDKEAREIMQKVEDRYDGDTMSSDMTMVLIDKNKNKRIRKIKSINKDYGKDTHTLLFFKSPADVKNTGFLTYDYNNSNKDDDQWLYLPALRKTKRISSSEQSNSFMGSDFNYSDMNSRRLDEYNYKLVKEATVKNNKVWIIEQAAKTKEYVEEIGYKKSLLFVRQDNFVVIRSINWVNDNGSIKYFDVKNLELINNIWVATNFTMTKKRGKKMLHKTIIKLDNIKFNKKIADSKFSLRQLKKGI